MRIRFGKTTYFCTSISKSDDSKTLTVQTTDDFYSIDFYTEKEAQIAYTQLLKEGYYDASNNEYINISHLIRKEMRMRNVSKLL